MPKKQKSEMILAIVKDGQIFSVLHHLEEYDLSKRLAASEVISEIHNAVNRINAG